MPPFESFIPTRILTPDHLADPPYKVRSLAEAIAHEPPGVYTVARTFHGNQTLLLDSHLDRLEQSAHLMEISLSLDRVRLRAALREVLQAGGYEEAKFRITVPRDQREHIYLAVEPFHPVPDEILKAGAHVITVPIMRENPVVKTTAWMSVRRPTYDALPQGVYEGIMVGSHGALLEGLSSNFYGVLNGQLHTAMEGVLAGITRVAVLEVARDILPVRDDPVCVEDIEHLSEAFLTSSGRGVVPITKINGQPVGPGTVGACVTQLMASYDAWTEAHLEPI